jgi:hypothetical protein
MEILLHPQWFPNPVDVCSADEGIGNFHYRKRHRIEVFVMDQLKQVLKYQFWILLAVALILPFVGWFMSRSGMISEAQARADTLKKLNESLQVRPDDPNETWPQQVGVINAEQEKQALLAWRALYERQKPFMVWPKRMVDEPSKIEPVHQEIYREDYAKELERIRQIVKPIDDETGNGLVRYGEELLPSPNSEWTFQAPTAAQIEAAQEDLWLLTAILTAIAEVNEGASSVYDASIREIVELLLRGGSPKGAGGSSVAKPATGTAGGHAAAPTGGAMGLSMRGGLGGMSARSDSAIGNISDHKINPNEDLGPERAAAKTGGTPTTAATPGTRAGHGASPALTPMAMGDRDIATSGASRGGGAGTNRYCDERKEWRTRGFSLEVIMDHRRVPDLLVALSNMTGWPTNILRVHVADSSDGDLVGTEGPAPSGDMRSMMQSGMRGAGSGAPPGPAGGHAGRGLAPSPPPMSRAMQRRLDRDSDSGPVATSNAPSAVDDPNLARVSIVGLVYIFLKPPELPPTTTPTQSPGAPQVPVAAVPADPATATTDGEPTAGSDDAKAAGDADEKPEPKTDESIDEPPAGAADSEADSRPKTEDEGKAGEGGTH